MTHHHHETGRDHPARAMSPSLLRMSAAERFVAALAIAGVLWVAVWWVMAIDRGLGVRDIAYLPQVAEIDRSFPINVYDLVAMGAWQRIGAFGAIRNTERDRIHGAIATVGLTGFERRPIAGLSGGQMQRVLFARLLLQDSRLIVLDEPFNAIDERTVADLVALVHRWHGEHRTVLAALHDMNLVRRHFPQTLLMAREPIAWGETGLVLTPENLIKARRMCEAFEEAAAECAVAAE